MPQTQPDLNDAVGVLAHVVNSLVPIVGQLANTHPDEQVRKGLLRDYEALYQGAAYVVKMFPAEPGGTGILH